MKLLLLLYLTIIFISCVEHDDITGTVDDVDTSIKAMVVNPDSTPAVGAKIKIYAVNDTTRTPEKQTTTDENGTFGFDGLSKGTYNVWAENDELVAFQDSVIITKDTVYYKTDTLGDTYSIKGYVGVQPNHDPRIVTVQVLGTHLYSNVNEQGLFSLKDLAEGEYNLRLVATTEGYTPTFYQLTVDDSSEDTLKDTLRMIYTGIPIVSNLKAVYSAITGMIQLTWDSTDYYNLLDYLIYKDDYESRSYSEDIFDATENNEWSFQLYSSEPDDSQWDMFDSTNVHLKFRVAIRTNEQKIGETYKFAAVECVSPYNVIVPVFPVQDTIVTGMNVVNLKWKSVPDAEKYYVQISTDDDFTDVILETESEDTTAKSDSLPKGDYFWRFRAADREEGLWSSVSHFTIDGPIPPVLIGPIDSMPVPWESQINFSWKSSQNAKKYAVEISKTDDFDSLVYARGLSDTEVTTRLSTGVYYWRVRGINKYGLAGKWSEAVLPYGLFAPIKLPGTHSVRHVIETSDRGIAVAGNTVDGDVVGNIIFSKYDITGSLEWSREYLGIKKYVRIEYFEEIETGGYVLLGWALPGIRSNEIYGYGNAHEDNAVDCYLIKIDETGNVEWEIAFQDSIWDMGLSVCQNIDNSFTVLRRRADLTSDTIISAFWAPIALTKVDANGEIVWEKYHDSLYANNMGIIKADENNNNIIATSDFIAETDVEGDIVWMKYYNNPARTVHTFFKTADDYYILEGTRHQRGMNIFKFDATGNMVDSVYFEDFSYAENYISGQHIQETDENDFIISCDHNVSGKGKILKVNHNFTIIWEFDLDEYSPVIQKNPGDGFLVGTRNNIYKINSKGEMYSPDSSD